MKTDPTTWCSEDIPAAKYLADTLTEIGDEKLISKVNGIFHKFNIRLNALNGLNKPERVFYLELLMKKTEENITASISYTKVKSLTLNVITTLYRQELHNKLRIK